MRRWLLALVSVVLFGLAIHHVVRSRVGASGSAAPAAPAGVPYPRAVAGTGIVESESENIALGSPLSGIVKAVHVHVGERVGEGDRLFELDDRMLQAELETRKARLAAAEARLRRLESLPRAEELPVGEAKVQEARANFAALEDQVRRAQQAFSRGALAEGNLVRLREEAKAAGGQLARAQAEHALTGAGAWEADKRVARAEVAEARALCRETEIELERLVVRAAVDADVLQVNIRPGEFVAAEAGRALILLGQVCQLHIRVAIDEADIPRFRPGSPATAVVRGGAGASHPLTFVRVEPFVVPKRSLTAVADERVDTRVLQVIYALPLAIDSLYVGQQVDVYIDAGPPGEGPALSEKARGNEGG